MITKCLSFVFLFVSCWSHAQVHDDFSQVQNPLSRWGGDTMHFRINESLQLQSNGPASSGSIFIETYSNALSESSWTFWLKMNFESSVSNYCKVFLAASTADFHSPVLEAFYLKVGGVSGNKDGFDLYYQKGNKHTLVAKGRETRAAGNPVVARVKVVHLKESMWEVYSDTTGGDDFQLESSGDHSASFVSEAFGFMCTYSSTRRTSFYFDDVMITGGTVDFQAPMITSIQYRSNMEGWQITCDEALSISTQPLVFIEGEVVAFAYELINHNAILLKDTTFRIAPGVRMYVSLHGIEDRRGNSQIHTIALIRPKIPSKGEVVINELLFNPFSYAVDFVELYNSSPWYIELSGLEIANHNRQSVPIPELVLEPQSYRVFSKDSLAVMEFYALTERNTFTNINLPAFPDDRGSVVLMTSNGDVIDQFNYFQEMHHPMLENKNGVSLERVSVFSASDWKENWQSASMSSGGATPGYSNSQSRSVDEPHKTLSIDPQTIAPGTDGYRNYSTIHFNLPQNGGTARIDIFSLQGHWIRSLQPSGPLGLEGWCIWDGTDSNLQPVSTGLYLLLAEFTFPDGGRLRVKDTISVLSH